jgi:hypothetical protein
MKGLGNYRFQRQEERKPVTLLSYRGAQALVRLHNGSTFAIPAKPLKALNIEPQTRFLLIIVRCGKRVEDIRVERFIEARPARAKAVTPKILMKDGRRLITRR